jgi:hypothetical protein
MKTLVYNVVILDTDGCELANHEEHTLTHAKASARMCLTEPDYLAAGVVKVEVRDANGECVWDRFATRQLTDVAAECKRVIERADAADVALDDGNVVDLLADNIPHVSLADLRCALVISGHGSRFPKATA